MTVSQTQIDAVLTWIYNQRAVDVQTLSNQDNPQLLGKKHTIEGIAFGNVTLITVSLTSIANFKVNQVIKFVDILDATLAAELARLVPEELTITDITGDTITIDYDGTGLAGIFTSGKILNTFNNRILSNAARRAIVQFELYTGIPFNYTSEHHLDFVTVLTFMKLLSRASAEYSSFAEEKKLYESKFERAKKEFLSGDDAVLDENNYDMDNRDMRKDFGISYPSNQDFAD